MDPPDDHVPDTQNTTTARAYIAIICDMHNENVGIHKNETGPSAFPPDHQSA
jgi:hypothetical protein